MKNEDQKQRDKEEKEKQPDWVRKKKPSTEEGDGVEEYTRDDPNLRPGEQEDKSDNKK